ncbi:unnamed protein product [Anisakis simplex]|uniref:Uncharacterized protein n=1 Tax=Anisakis simplex TaxID=6269 RepID=A0A0M3J6A7_ANISI|nr:unnamed protein product [Anisakis simplex]
MTKASCVNNRSKPVLRAFYREWQIKISRLKFLHLIAVLLLVKNACSGLPISLPIQNIGSLRQQLLFKIKVDLRADLWDDFVMLSGEDNITRTQNIMAISDDYYLIDLGIGVPSKFDTSASLSTVNADFKPYVTEIPANVAYSLVLQQYRYFHDIIRKITCFYMDCTTIEACKYSAKSNVLQKKR